MLRYDLRARRSWSSTGLATSLLLLLSACGRTHTVTPAPAVAMVAGERIDARDVQHYLSYTTQYYSHPGNSSGPPLQCTRASRNPTCSVVERQVLARLLQERVVLAYARDHNINLDESERRRVEEAMKDRTIFRPRDATFLRQVLTRQLLIQKVEQVVAPASAKRGPAYHVHKFNLPIRNAKDNALAYRQAIDLATDGKPIPSTATMRDEWLAPLRLPHRIRQALDYAEPGQFVGPFSHHGGYLVVQLLKRAVHSYGAPARAVLAARYFHVWLQRQMANGHPRCFDARGKSQACPL